MKTTLLISSLLVIALLAFAAVRENYFTEWRGFQKQYGEILIKKAQDDNERRIASDYPIELKQIVVPELNTVDRCVSCHVGTDDPRMTDLPQPFAAHPGRFLEDHDMDKFGCTVCHGGQGRAVSKKEAHALEDDTYWERPLLPSPLNQSSCGLCHDAGRLDERRAPVLTRGLAVFTENGCLGCHTLRGRGGGSCPVLDKEGDKIKHGFPFANISTGKTVADWHRAHLEDPQKVVPGSRMPKVPLDVGDREALITYILSLREVKLTEWMIPEDKYEGRYLARHPENISGEKLYKQFCIRCHGDGLGGLIHETFGRMIPSIRNPDFLSAVSDDFLFSNIRDGRPGTEMPAWGMEGGGLSDAEIRALTAYLLEGRKEQKELAFVPSPGADAVNGQKLFEANCTACHGRTKAGLAPWFGNRGFQATYSDALIGHTIKYGRAGTLMIAFGSGAGGKFSDQEISDMVRFIRGLK